MKKFTKKRVGAIALATLVALGVAVLVARPASADTTTVCNSTAGWDYSASAGKNTPILPEHFTADGLVLDLTGARAGGKAAGYLGVAPTALSVVAAFQANLTLDVEVKEGPYVPGYQLALDVTGDGIGDGYLVGEPVYGDKWWASNSLQPFPGIEKSDGGGSQYQGTLAEFATANSNAKVVGIGFSLGSGVTGKVLLKKLNYGDTVFEFKACVAPTSVTTSTSSSSSAVTTSTTAGSSSSSTTPPSSSSSSSPSSTVGTSTTPEPYYANCDAVKAALGHWILVGEPGYRLDLDGDANGIACQALGAPVVVTTTTPTRVELVDNRSPEDLAYTGVGSIVPVLGGLAVLALLGGGLLILITTRRKA